MSVIVENAIWASRVCPGALRLDSAEQERYVEAIQERGGEMTTEKRKIVKPLKLLAAMGLVVSVAVGACAFVITQRDRYLQSIVASRAAELGVSYREQRQIIEEFYAEFRVFIPLTRREAFEMGALGLQYRFAGDQLAGLLEAGTGLADGYGKPIEGVQALIDAAMYGRTLEKFGVFDEDTAERLSRAGASLAEKRARARPRRGTTRPGGTLGGRRGKDD